MRNGGRRKPSAVFYVYFLYNKLIFALRIIKTPFALFVA